MPQTKKQSNEQTETLEKGNIYFFYRPRVEEEDPGSKADIQQLYAVMDLEEPKDRYRLTIIGRKKMPKPDRSGKAREWGFVDIVRKKPDAIRDALSEEIYQTKTRGERRRPAARPCGEGVYRIVRRGDHTELAYELELPRDRGSVQKDLDIEEQGRYIISVKNPEKGSPQAAGLSEEKAAEFPKKLQQRFEDRRFAPADPPEFLDQEGAEFVLISAAKDVEGDLGIDLDAESESAQSAEIFSDLRLDRENRKTEPLLAGDWA
jgi:hypothetical protein